MIIPIGTDTWGQAFQAGVNNSICLDRPVSQFGPKMGRSNGDAYASLKPLWYRAVSVLLPLLVLAFVIMGSGCSPAETRLSEVDLKDDEYFRLNNPGKWNVNATGIGCGGKDSEAAEQARKVAHFNLRGLTGPHLTMIHYKFLREVPISELRGISQSNPNKAPHPNQVCVEYQATKIK